MTPKSLFFDIIYFAYLLMVLFFSVAQPSEEELLLMNRNMWIFLIASVVGTFFTMGLNQGGIKTLGTYIFEPAHKKVEERSEKPWMKTFWGIQLLVGFLVTFVVGLKVIEFDIYDLLSQQGFAGAHRIFGDLIQPDMSVFARGVLAIIETVYIAFLATVIAVPIAFILSFLAAKNIMGSNYVAFGFYVILRVLMNITRSIEPLIWAIIFSVWVGIGPFAGMLALMIHSAASLTKQFSEIIECADEGPIEGIQSTGADVLQVIWYAVVPQVILPYISFTIFRWDVNVRMATVIGLVGGGGIGTMLIQYQGQALWQAVGCLAIIIVAVVWAMDTASAYIREAIK